MDCPVDSVAARFLFFAGNPLLRNCPDCHKFERQKIFRWKNCESGISSTSYQKQYVGWITSAKKEETRQKRPAEAIQRLKQSKKPGMK